jgi:hypothetical protein
MKRLAVVFTTVLAFVALATLASCEGGTFVDPGPAAAPGLGSSGGSGGGGGGGGGGGYESMPSYLSSNASLSAAQSKVEAIIDYCDSNSGNSAVRYSAVAIQSSLSYFTSSAWSSQGSAMIASINNLIDLLQ